MTSDRELLPLYRAEHSALHAWFVARLFHKEPKEIHERYCDMIDAHDAVANAMSKEDEVADATPEPILPEEMSKDQRFDMLTDRARKIFTNAVAEAERMGHHYVGTEHILLGMLNDTESIAAGVLIAQGVDLDKTRIAVEFIIGRGDPKKK